MFDLNFIERTATALREKAKEGKQFEHLASHANHLEADAIKNLNRAGRLAMRLITSFKLNVNLSDDVLASYRKHL